MLLASFRTQIWLLVIVSIASITLGCSQSPQEILEKQGIEVSNASLISHIRKGDITVVKLLLEAGVDVNHSDNDSDPALFAAIEVNNTEAAMMMLDYGANPNALNRNTNTPLIKLAREHNNLALFDALVAKGADINKVNESKRTALMYAINSGAFPLAMRLLELGAESLKADAYGVTPILLAAGQNNVGVFNVLLSGGADVHSKNPNGASVILIASANIMYPGVLETLIKYGADIHAKDQNGTSVLMNVAWKSPVRNVKTLVDNGADIHAIDSVGRSALFYAIDSGEPEKVEYLINAGAKLDILDKYNTSLLIKAAQHGNPEIFRLLLQTQKINLDVKDSEKHTAMDYAKANGYEEIVGIIDAHKS